MHPAPASALERFLHATSPHPRPHHRRSRWSSRCVPRSRHRFTFAQVDEIAQKRAAAKYVPLPDVLPPQLKKLTPQQDAAFSRRKPLGCGAKRRCPSRSIFIRNSTATPAPHLRRKSITSIAREVIPALFADLLQFLRRHGPTRPRHWFSIRRCRPISATPAFTCAIPTWASAAIRIRSTAFFPCLAADYFRALAKDQVYGLSAPGRRDQHRRSRARPEEFPNFTDWWLHEPTPTRPNWCSMRCSTARASPALTSSRSGPAR